MLVKPIATSITERNATGLRRHIHVVGYVKSENERGYYISDAINDAIDGEDKIKLQYADYVYAEFHVY